MTLPIMLTPDAALSFNYWRQVESYNGAYDQTYVQLSTDGGITWSDYLWYKDARDPSQAAWLNSGDISLAAYAGAVNALLRFTFDSVDGWYNNYAGWFIDDVQVSNLEDVTRKYYYAGGRRVAMSENGTLYWLLTDHLGSTAITAYQSGSKKAELRYKAWGETRYSSGTTPTTYRFTGQRWDGTIGLYFYNARYYDLVLGRFVQPDTIVPGSGNPQGLNRYSYVLNNPVRYWDPSGYDPLDAEWQREFRATHGGRAPTDEDRRDRLFSLLLAGSGPNGSWTEADWRFYSSRQEDLWRGRIAWPGASEPGLERFALHVHRLAAWYKPNEKTQFVRAFALVFGGIRYTWSGYVVPKSLAALEALHGPRLEPLYEGRAGWDPSLVDFPPDPNPSHHYAGLFFLGFFTPEKFAQAVNFMRDPHNPPDIALGNIALRDAQIVRETPAGHWLVERSIWSLAVTIR